MQKLQQRNLDLASQVRKLENDYQKKVESSKTMRQSDEHCVSFWLIMNYSVKISSERRVKENHACLTLSVRRSINFIIFCAKRL